MHIGPGAVDLALDPAGKRLREPHLERRRLQLVGVVAVEQHHVGAGGAGPDVDVEPVLVEPPVAAGPRRVPVDRPRDAEHGLDDVRRVHPVLDLDVVVLLVDDHDAAGLDKAVPLGELARRDEVHRDHHHRGPVGAGGDLKVFADAFDRDGRVPRDGVQARVLELERKRLRPVGCHRTTKTRSCVPSVVFKVFKTYILFTGFATLSRARAPP